MAETKLTPEQVAEKWGFTDSVWYQQAVDAINDYAAQLWEEHERVLDVLRELVDAVKAIREDVFSNSGRVTGRTQTSAQSALEKAEAALLAADKEKGNE